MQSICYSCPRHCRADRISVMGFCQAPRVIVVASHCLHRGEEPIISGTRGSGTIFFSYCNLRCVYCQNHAISHGGQGVTVGHDELVDIMLQLQENGAHNINLVSPSHYALALTPVLRTAKDAGLRIPIVYNTNGYDSVDVIDALNGLVDIYVPDLKYALNEHALTYSGCADYAEKVRNAIRKMYDQVGPIILDDNEIALRGLLVRHLVLPNDIDGSTVCFDFLRSISTDMYVSVMAQYNPLHHAKKHTYIQRKITYAEYQKALDYALSCCFTHIFSQEMTSSENYLPDFDQEHPFEA